MKRVLSVSFLSAEIDMWSKSYKNLRGSHLSLHTYSQCAGSCRGRTVQAKLYSGPNVVTAGAHLW